MSKNALVCRFYILSVTSSGIHIEPNGGGFTKRNSAGRAQIPILISPSLATLKVLRMLKVIIGILKKLLATKLVMEMLSGELWSRIVLSFVQAIQRKKAEVFVKMKTPSHDHFSSVGFDFSI